MHRNDDVKLQVQQATDLIRLIGEHVALKPKGKEFVGLCPFHDDHSPSMSVSPAKQIYKCFSCGAGGDAFSFVMNYHKMAFPEAMRFLAERAGITLPERSEKHEEHASPRRKLLEVNTQAMEFFRRGLTHPQIGAAAREYVAQRRISDEMVQSFQIGYAPDGWDALSREITQNRWDQQGFVQAGLISARQGGGGYYDRMRHRLIFPIMDEMGRPIAFGGRKMRAEDEPKYLNSPETALFNKSATLYGLAQAKSAIIAERTAVIVEGYTDVIASHQAGMRNVVATLGTALTSQHVKMLRRFVDKVVLIFDPDEAGQKAADRAIEVFFKDSVDVAVAVLPGGMDPADLFETEDGVAQWQKAMEQATSALEYQFARVHERFEAATTITGKENIAREYLQHLYDLGLTKQGVIGNQLVLNKLESQMGLAKSRIDSILKDIVRARPQMRPAPVSQEPMQEQSQTTVVPGASAHRIKALEVAERQLIGALLVRPQAFHESLPSGQVFDEAVTPSELFSPACKSLYEIIYQQLSSGADLTLASLIADLASEGHQSLTDLATTAESEVSKTVGDDTVRLQEILYGAVEAIVSYHRGLEYDKTRAELVEKTHSDQTGGAAGKQSLARQTVEHLKNNPSPIRIARIGR